MTDCKDFTHDPERAEMIAELEKTAILESGATCIAHDGSKVVQEDGRCLYAHAFSLVTDSCEIVRAPKTESDDS